MKRTPGNTGLAGPAVKPRLPADKTDAERLLIEFLGEFLGVEPAEARRILAVCCADVLESEANRKVAGSKILSRVQGCSHRWPPDSRSCDRCGLELI